MIDALVTDIPDANKGFRLTFSAREFSGFQKKLTWVRGDSLGNYTLGGDFDGRLGLPRIVQVLSRSAVKNFS